MRDVCHITNRSRQFIVQLVESGELEAIRLHPTAKYQFKRQVVREWLKRSGFKQPAA